MDPYLNCFLCSLPIWETPHKSVWSGLSKPCVMCCVCSIKDEEDDNCSNYPSAVFLHLFYLVQARLANYFILKWKIIKSMSLQSRGTGVAKLTFRVPLCLMIYESLTASLPWYVNTWSFYVDKSSKFYLCVL